VEWQGLSRRQSASVADARLLCQFPPTVLWGWAPDGNLPARFMRYLKDRDKRQTRSLKVWAVMGDRRNGRARIPGRDRARWPREARQLDFRRPTAICSSLDGPVRGNVSHPELEADFAVACGTCSM